jgi:hypothetical protein
LKIKEKKSIKYNKEIEQETIGGKTRWRNDMNFKKNSIEKLFFIPF